MANKNRVSIKDVARESGVSVATVSRIINHTGRFSVQTEKRVNEVIEQLGYEKNKLAVSLRSNESHTVGIMVPDITNEFFSDIVKQCEQNLFAQDYASIICNTERSAERENAYSQVLLEHRVDGLIIISSHNGRNEIIQSNSIPTVFIDRNLHTGEESIVASAHYSGAKNAVRYLIDTKRSPFMVMTKTESSATLDRVRAFRDVLADSGIENIDERILHLDLTSNQFLQAAPSLNQFIQNVFFANHPIGLFGVNDNVAYMIIRAAKNLGLRIPEDVSVIGFDGTSFSKIASPTLTTVVQHTDQIAEQACTLLLRHISEKKAGLFSTPKSIEIPVTLKLQESTINQIM